MEGHSPPLGGFVLAKRPRMADPEPEPKDAPPSNVVLPEDNFWKPRVVDGTYQYAFTLITPPSGSPSGDMLTFHIEKLYPGFCAFPSEMIFAFKMKLSDKDGKPPPLTSNVSVIPGFPTTMWKSVNVSLNSTDVTGGDNGCWPLRCHVKSMVNVAASGRHRDYMYGCQKMGEGGYEDDTSTQYLRLQKLFLTAAELQPVTTEPLLDVPEGEEATSLGAVVRQANEKAVEYGVHGHAYKRHYSKDGVIVFAKLPLDLAASKLPIVSGVSIQLQLIKADPKFSVFCADDDAAEKGYKVDVLSAQALTTVRKYGVGLQLDLEKRLAKAGAIDYHFDRVHIKKLAINEGLQTWSTEDVKDGAQMPRRCMVLLMPQAQWVGDYKSCPLASFSKYGTIYAVDDLFFSLNSQPLLPLGNLYCGLNNEQFMRAAYLQMQHVLSGGGGQQPSAVDLSFEEFKKGNFYWMQDLTRSRRSHDGRVLHETVEGTLRLDVRFEKPISAPLNVFLISEYPARISVAPSRKVIYHYADKV